MVEGYPADMGGWGVSAIFKEAGRLLFKYIRLLHPFFLAFLLPVAVIHFLDLIGLSWLASHVALHRFGGVFDHHHHHHHHHHHLFAFNALGASFKGTDELPPLLVQLMLVSIAFLIVMWLLVILALAAISMTVQYIYSDREDPCIVKAIFKALPAAFLRLFVTFLWILLIDLFIIWVVSLPFYLLSAVFKDKIILESVHKAFLLVALLLVELLFIFAYRVAVLEPGNYGLAALKRSFDLVQAKLPTALALFLIDLVFAFTHFELAQIIIKSGLPLWISYILAVLSALIWLSFVAYWLLVVTVFYFSSKLKSAAEEQLLPEENPYRPLAVSAES